MKTYLHVYQAESGQWSGLLLEPVAGIAGCEHPVDVVIEARERFPACTDLPRDARQAPQGHAVDMMLPTGGRLQVDAVPDGWTWAIVGDECDLEEGQDPDDWEGAIAHAGAAYSYLAEALAAGLVAAGIRGD
jgi:hypothetical protein